MLRLKVIENGAELERIRGNWFIWARDQRHFVECLPRPEKEKLRAISSILPPCEMTVFGGPPHDWPPEEAYRLAKQYGIENIDLANPWFLSEDGWKEYLRCFESLPEIVSLVACPSKENGGIESETIEKSEISASKRRRRLANRLKENSESV